MSYDAPTLTPRRISLMIPVRVVASDQLGYHSYVDVNERRINGFGATSEKAVGDVVKAATKYIRQLFEGKVKT